MSILNAPISYNDVVLAYRLILGRDPENEIAVTAKLKRCKSIDALRIDLLNSKEFFENNKSRFLKQQSLNRTNSYSNVAFAIAPGFLVFLAGFLGEKRNKSGYDKFAIIVTNKDALDLCYIRLVEDLGGDVFSVHQFLDDSNKPFSHCDNFYAHSFGSLTITEKLLNNIKTNTVLAYTDGLKNDYQVENFSLNKYKFKSLVFFGWVYKKDNIENFCNKFELVSMNVIVKTWQKLRVLFNINSSVFNFQNNDILLLLRYWGRGVYKFKPNISYTDMVDNYLKQHQTKKTEKIYIKGDPRVVNEAEYSLNQDLTGKGYSVASFDLLFNSNEKLDHYPFEVLLNQPIQNKIHCFDSTISIYLTWVGCCNVVLPSKENLEGIFLNNEIPKSTFHYSDVYQKVCSSFKKIKSENKKAIVQIDDDRNVILRDDLEYSNNIIVFTFFKS